MVLLGLLAADAYGAGGAEGSSVPQFWNAYQATAGALGWSDYVLPLLSGLLSLLVLTFIGWRYQRYVKRCLISGDVEPSGRFSLVSLTEAIAKMIYDLGGDLLGKTHLPMASVIAALFFFILITNLSGLIPFFPPASGDFSANLGLGLMVFVIYHVAGVRAQGWLPYIKHFAGPKVPIPVLGVLLPLLIFVVEIISHSFRPVSLSLRLMGNIFGDHMLVAVFTGMVYGVIPSILLFFGVLVSLVQAFVFSLLSGIYLSMAVSHDH